MEGKRKSPYICLIICLFFIVFITLLSRTPSLSRVTHLTPLWSYTTLREHWKQIFLNICLFIPFGFFLRNVTRPRSAFLISLTVSMSIEFFQFLTYRGMLDCDDLISNLLGTTIGIGICTAVERCIDGKDRWISSVTLLMAGFLGCVITIIPAVKTNINTQITRQFWFDIESTHFSQDDNLVIAGKCFTYGRPTPSYTLFLGNTELKTDIDGDNFIAEMTIPIEKAELQIRFSGYHIMPTGIYIHQEGQVEYIVENVAPPDIGIPDNAVLKAYSPDYDTFVYELDGKIIWLIGMELDANTEVIYLIYTDEPEHLPEKRLQYKFDNRGFRAKENEWAKNELLGINHYRVFEQEIPTEYNVTAIVVGFNTEGTITWIQSFRPSTVSKRQ